VLEMLKVRLEFDAADKAALPQCKRVVGTVEYGAAEALEELSKFDVGKVVAI
jgi:hypothetical protein